MAAVGLASDNEGVAMVDLILNQASLQAGTIKYDMKPFDFKSVVAEVVEAHQGKVWEDTEVGQGSTFYIELPLTRK